MKPPHPNFVRLGHALKPTPQPPATDLLKSPTDIVATREVASELATGVSRDKLRTSC